MGNPVVHWELWSQDPENLAAFYVKVFNWQVNMFPGIDYRLIDTGGQGGINGGIMKPKQGPWPGNMAFYIDVDDLDAYKQKIVAAGGKVIVDRQEVAGIGSFSLFSDPDNRVLGLWQRNPTGGE